jgi:oligoribonuclease NrnB/cAMP/cGMP phosphodiesterase (DHH superfamily)
VRGTAVTYPGIFDTARSGATIAWSYFHPETPMPALFKYLEDYDLFRFSLPETKAINAFITLEPYEFPRWQEIMDALEQPESAAEIVKRGEIYLAHLDKLAEKIAASAGLVEFEGQQVYLSGTVLQAFTDYIGHTLAEKQPPFALMVRPVAEGLRVSIRGVEGFDVSKVAQKYGGNGHPGAAAFRITWGDPIPWKAVPENENPSD